MAKSVNGFSVVVSNQEYTLIRKVIAKGRILEDELEEFYQELGNKLYRRGVLNKIKHGDDYYFIPVDKEQ